MPLNPQRGALAQLGRSAARHDSPFQAGADAALAEFRAARGELERRVRRGDLTVKVAREQAAAAAGELRDRLGREAAGFSPAPRAFLDRLVEAADQRARDRDRATVEGLQRETNRLLRQSLVEQQLQNRAAEFEGRVAVRPVAGGAPTPTLDSLLAFHESSTLAGDESAREWARRRLEAMRPYAAEPEAQRRIDLACERPDAVNPRVVGRYLEALAGRGADDCAAFAAEALAARDANACVAAFLLAREAPEGPSARWVRDVLTNVGQFPDAALATLRAHEVERRQAEAEAASASAEFAAALAEAEARLPGLEAPDAAEVERRARFEARPVAAPDEPIGLAPARRGLTRDEFQAAATEPGDADEA